MNNKEKYYLVKLAAGMIPNWPKEEVITGEITPPAGHASGFQPPKHQFDEVPDTPIDHEAVGVGQDTGIVGPYPEGSDMVNPGMRPPEPTNIGEIFAHPPVKENMGFYGKGFGVPGELPPHLAGKEPKSLDTNLADIFGKPPGSGSEPSKSDGSKNTKK